MKLRLGKRFRYLLVLYLVAGGIGAGIAGADFTSNGFPPPSGLQVTPAQTSLLLTWKPVYGATGYGVYLDGNYLTTTATTSWNYTGLACATTHLLSVDSRKGPYKSKNRSSITGTTTACGQSGPPVNTAIPVVSGTAQQGQALTTTAGSWTGAQPITYAYQWIRCDTNGANCAAVSGATSPSYVLTASDAGSTMRSKVTASNGAGSTVAQSSQTGVVQPSSSSSTFGTTTPGTLTDNASNGYKEVSKYTAPSPGLVSKLTGYVSGLGAGSGSQPVQAVMYADAGGNPGALLGVSNTVNIPAGQAWAWVDFTFPSPVSIGSGTIWMGYIAGSPNNLTQLRYDSSTNELHYNTNAGGWGAGPTNPFGAPSLSNMHYSLYATYTPTSGTPPVDVTPPTISGTAQQGQTLTGDDGVWTGAQPITYTYQWLRCDGSGANCASISGATADTYTLVSADVNSTMRFQVTGTNSYGASTVQSAQTGTVTSGSPPPPPPPASGTANVWVDGGSGSCTRSSSAVSYSGSTACADLNSAYRAAKDGDTVGIVGGHYPAQEIDYSSSKSTSGPAVTFVPSGSVSIDSIDLGNGAGCIPAAPNWVTFDGGANKDLNTKGFGSCRNDHVTVRNMKIGVGVATLGALINFHSPSNLVFDQNVIGPACCGYNGTSGSSPIEMRLAVSTGDPNPTNVQVTNNLFQGSARYCSDWDANFSSYGPCPAPSCPDSTQCHNDAIHVYGCTSCTFADNRFPFYDVQGIYLEEVNGGTEQSGTIENNYFGHDIEGTWHAVWASFGGTSGGTWNIRFNTLSEWNAMDVNASDQHGRYGTGTINVIGNLGGRLGNDTGACGGSTLTMVYRYNMWTQSSVPWISHCDPTDGGPYPLSTITSWISSDGHLLSGISAPNGFVLGAGLCIPKDIDGDTRPSVGCAAGEDEFN